MVWEGDDTKMYGIFHVSVQYLLIFGAEMWVVTPQILNALESLHNQAMQRISGKVP